MLHAHLNNKIDLTQPIHPLAEALILRHEEVLLELEMAKLYPIHDDENIYYVHSNWINTLKSYILQVEDKAIANNNSIDAKVQAWKKLNSKK